MNDTISPHALLADNESDNSGLSSADKASETYITEPTSCSISKELLCTSDKDFSQRGSEIQPNLSRVEDMIPSILEETSNNAKEMWEDTSDLEDYTKGHDDDDDKSFVECKEPCRGEPFENYIEKYSCKVSRLSEFKGVDCFPEPSSEIKNKKRKSLEDVEKTLKNHFEECCLQTKEERADLSSPFDEKREKFSNEEKDEWKELTEHLIELKQYKGQREAEKVYLDEENKSGFSPKSKCLKEVQSENSEGIIKSLKENLLTNGIVQNKDLQKTRSGNHLENTDLVTTTNSCKNLRDSESKSVTSSEKDYFDSDQLPPPSPKAKGNASRPEADILEGESREEDAKKSLKPETDAAEDVSKQIKEIGDNINESMQIHLLKSEISHQNESIDEKNSLTTKSDTKDPKKIDTISHSETPKNLSNGIHTKAEDDPQNNLPTSKQSSKKEADDSGSSSNETLRENLSLKDDNAKSNNNFNSITTNKIPHSTPDNKSHQRSQSFPMSQSDQLKSKTRSKKASFSSKQLDTFLKNFKQKVMSTTILKKDFPLDSKPVTDYTSIFEKYVESKILSSDKAPQN